MATDVKLPRLGQGMESGVIVRWLKAEGDAVAKGDPLYELDTDKVTQEVESELDGVLTKIVVAEGEVEVGTTVAVIDGEAPAESPDGEAESPDGASARPAEPKPEPEADAETAEATAEPTSETATDAEAAAAPRDTVSQAPSPHGAGA